MPSGWEALPTTDDGAGGACRLETPADRIRTACKLAGMVLLGLAIGCTFVLIRELMGLKT
jgi:hypothetical protein